MSSVIKATQAISGEIQLNELLKKLIKITVENAGAVTGILILLKEGSLFIEAEYNINTMAINILKSLPVVESKKVPLSILNYVESKKEILILKDATLEKKFSRDDYIISNKPKSVLCMPLLNQGKLTGILYLEHPHLPGAFTDDRIETLKILSSQASISIDNARLYDDMTELNTAYERFFPGNFLELLEKKNITKILLGDQVQKNMSILFSDIRSFTSLSEKMSPQDNFNFINSYLKRVGPVIRKYDGFIDKFIGDAVMALFPDSPNTAIDASISMLDEVYLMNQKRKSKGYQSISIGIGVHTGSLILGVVGEHNRMAGTVISDSVNLASRLEGLTKMYNTNLITSLTTYNALSNKEKYIHRVLDRVKVKGKQEAVTVIEILNGLGNKLIDLKLSTKENFERGASLYSSKEFIGSIECFRNVLKIDPLDKAADIYLKRAEYYSKVGVPPDWEGIESLDTK
jgi:class 3 adenylate cyclase